MSLNTCTASVAIGSSCSPSCAIASSKLASMMRDEFANPSAVRAKSPTTFSLILEQDRVERQRPTLRVERSDAVVDTELERLLLEPRVR